MACSAIPGAASDSTQVGQGDSGHRRQRGTTIRGGTRMASPFYTAEHEAYREVVRRFVEKEIEPYAHEWDEAGGFPRGLYEKAAEIGLLGLGFSGEYGGGADDKFFLVVGGLG